MLGKLSSRDGEDHRDSPGTTSRASIASLYSINPKPFMSLISVISPVPWVLKWASTSAFVATHMLARGADILPAEHFHDLQSQNQNRAIIFLPLRGRLPRYNLVEETSVMMGRLCVMRQRRRKVTSSQRIDEHCGGERNMCRRRQTLERCPANM